MHVYCCSPPNFVFSRSWVSALGGKLTKIFNNFNSDAVDEAWQAQAVMKGENELAAQEHAEVMHEASICTQVMMLQTMMTKKHLYKFQLDEKLSTTSDVQTSFATLYSEIIAQEDASEAFCKDCLLEENTPCLLYETLGSDRLVDPVGADFLNDLLHGVPDLHTYRSSKNEDNTNFGDKVNAEAANPPSDVASFFSNGQGNAGKLKGLKMFLKHRGTAHMQATHKAPAEKWQPYGGYEPKLHRAATDVKDRAKV